MLVKQLVRLLLNTVILFNVLPLCAEPINRSCYFGSVKDSDLIVFPCKVEWDATAKIYTILSQGSGKTYVISVGENQPLIDWGNGKKEKATAFHTNTCSRYTGTQIGSLALCRK